MPAFAFEHQYIDTELGGRSYGQTALADLDRDGRPEFITGRSGGDIFWYDYQAPDRWTRRLLGQNSPSDVGGAARDVDGNGWIDFVAGGAWRRNPGPPGDAPFERIVFDAALKGVHDIAVGDINGDGRLDICSKLWSPRKDNANGGQMHVDFLHSVGAAVAKPGGPAAGAGDGRVTVPRWQSRDFAFRSATDHANPFAVDFSAAITGPGGASLSSLGFYDGDRSWKVRVAPTIEGDWFLQTHSSDPALAGQTAAFVCVPNTDPNAHGGLQVDPQHPHHFRFEDGSRYFLMGYECDWLWALDTGNPELPTVCRFLDRLAAAGFNHILLNAYAHDCGWRKGKTGDDDYGPPPQYAWEGTNEVPDHGRFNLAFWQHYDRVLAEMNRRGIIAHIMIKVYNKQVHWPRPASPEDDLYFRWMVARYAAYPNVVWSFAKEAHNEKDLDYKLSRFRLLRECDPYHRLITNHDDDQAYASGAYNDLLDFRSDQQHRDWHDTILRQRTECNWPVVNVEFGYEHGPGGRQDKTYGVVQSPEEVCRRAWEICLAGGYGAYYYTYTAWDVLRPDDTPPGYGYFSNLRRFFETTRYWLLEPADSLVSQGYCLANPGNEVVVFLDQAAPFVLNLGALAAPLDAVWYHPFTAERLAAGKLTGGEVTLTPPGHWAGQPLVLHARLASD